MDYNEFKNIIIKFIRESKMSLGIFEEITDVKLEKKKSNNNNANFGIIVNNKFKYFIKLSPIDNTLNNEYVILKELPEEIGPYPYIFDNTKKIFPYEFEILTFEKGKDLIRYFEMHLVLLARKLAELHKIKSPNITINNKQYNKLNIYDYFVYYHEEYFKKNQKLIDDIYINQLIKHFQNFLKEYQNLFENISEFSLIHANLNPKNILFNEYDIRLINWESAHFCDNARDIATFFYDEISFDSNRIKLEKERSDFFLENYLKAYWSDSTFKQRVFIWIIYDMFSSLIKTRFKLLENNLNSLDKSKLENQSKELFEILKIKLKNQ